MIVEIALGIALAVLILAFLPQIIALGVVVIVAGIVLLVGAFALFYFSVHLDTLGAIAGFGAVVGSIWWIASSIESGVDRSNQARKNAEFEKMKQELHGIDPRD